MTTASWRDKGVERWAEAAERNESVKEEGCYMWGSDRGERWVTGGRDGQNMAEARS